MGIKRLTDKNAPEVRLSVGAGKGLLLMFDRGAPTECFFLERPRLEDCKKLLPYGKLEGAKFVGASSVLNLLKECFGPANLSRSVVSDSLVEAVFVPSSGKVRVRKDQIAGEEAGAEKKPEGKKPELKTNASAKNALNEPVRAKKKVLVIDDSKTIQKLLSKIIGSSENLEVLDVADRPSAAKEIIERTRPDLITLDIHMPEMNGVEFLKTYLKKLKIPVVMVSSVSVEEGPLVMEALSNGALTYIQKPSLEKMSQIAPDILEQLESLSENKESAPQPYKATPKSMGGGGSFDAGEGLIAIGSSTGGTKALQEILTALPAKIPPIVVVQHIPAVFSQALAERLNTLCPFRIKEAVDGELVRSDTVYIAPGGIQMRLERRGKEIKISLRDDPPVNRFKPSVDYMFDSIPGLKQENVVAAILTGMGKDGAQGLLKLKNFGARTLAQDEASCVVYGMPKEAVRLNAAGRIASLSDMADCLVEEYNSNLAAKSA